ARVERQSLFRRAAVSRGRAAVGCQARREMGARQRLLPRCASGRVLLWPRSERDRRLQAERGGGAARRRADRGRRGRAARGSAADRKSTRLNSSHVSISYAVFCLKKKK